MPTHTFSCGCVHADAPWAAAAAGLPVQQGQTGVPMSPQGGGHPSTVFHNGPRTSHRVPGAPVSPAGVAGTTVFDPQHMHGRSRRPGGTPSGDMAGACSNLPVGVIRDWIRCSFSSAYSTGSSGEKNIIIHQSNEIAWTSAYC